MAIFNFILWMQYHKLQNAIGTVTNLNIVVLHLTYHTIISFYLVQGRHKSK